MGRLIQLLYGIVCYIIFLASFLYAIGFLGQFGVPKDINTGTAPSFSFALLNNALLLGLFAVQHSLMARDFFKRWWTKIVPPPVERSTYVLLSSLILFLIFWQWQPMTGVIWNVDSPFWAGLLYGLFALGWAIVLVSTFFIDHFDLFGLRQVFRHFQKKEPASIGFQTPGLYKYVWHPLMLGFVIAFWATPHMTTGHLIFAIATTAYIIVGVKFEENALIKEFGDTYRDYRKQVPMIIPIPGQKYRGPSTG